MIKKILTLFMSLSLGGTVPVSQVENIFDIQKVSKIFFTLNLIFEDEKRLVFTSQEKKWKNKLESLSNEKLSKLQSFSWSMKSIDNKNIKTLFPDIEIINIDEYFSAFILALLMGPYGEQSLSSMNDNFALGIRFTQNHDLLVYNEKDLYTHAIAYKISGDDLLEELVGFYEQVEVLTHFVEKSTTKYSPKNLKLRKLSEESLAHHIDLSFTHKNDNENLEFTLSLINESLKRNSNSLEIAIVQKFMHTQFCYMNGECKDVSTIHEHLFSQEFYSLHAVSLGKLLLGLNLELTSEVYGREELLNLFYRYFKISDSTYLVKKVIKRFSNFTSRLIKHKLSEDEFSYIKKRLSNVNKDPNIQKELQIVSLEFSQIWADYHDDDSATITNALYLPHGVNRLIDVGEVKQWMHFKRKAKEDLILDVGRKAWAFSMNKDLRNESFIHKLSSAELMFPEDVYFTMEFDGVSFVKELRVKDFLNFMRSIQVRDLTLDSHRIVSTSNQDFSFGFSRISKKYIIVYNTQSNDGVAYRIPLSAYPNVSYGIGYLKREILTNKDKKLFENLPQKNKILQVIESQKNHKIDELEEVILSIKYIENIFSQDMNISTYKYNEVKLNHIKNFDEMIASNISSFSDKTLKHLIDLSFFSSNATDNYYFSILLVQELLRRNSLTLEHYFAQAYLSSFMGPTSVDRNLSFRNSLYNTYFPLFEEEVIVELLVGVSAYEMSPLNQENTMSHLLFSYLKNVKNLKGAKKVMRKFKFYMFNELEESYANHMKFKDYKWHNHDEYDNQTAYATLHELLDNNNSKVVEELLKVFTADILNKWRKIREKDIVAATKVLKRMVYTMEDMELVETQFTYDVLRQNSRAIDYKKMSFSLFYAYFFKIMTQGDELLDSNRQASFELLIQFKPYELEKRMLKDMKKSSEFKIRALKLFAYYWQVRGLRENYLYEIMAAIKGVNEGLSREEAIGLERDKILDFENDRLNKAKEDEKYKLNYIYEKALKYNKDAKENSIDAFIRFTKKLAITSPFTREYSFIFANYTTKILISLLSQRDFSQGKKILENYINNLLPYSGFHEKSFDVASNGIVLSILSKDNTVSQMIFDKILGKNFDIKDLENKLLLFNLSCYYATHNEKKKMLLSIRQALLYGKKSDEFLKDGDFKPYLDDKDFLLLFK